MTNRARPLRADAARNRARVLEVAYETFATEGLSVPIDEIARRAGVGAGTVYRHFPTKESLFTAIVTERMGRLVEDAKKIAKSRDAGEAFFAFLSRVVEEGATDLGLVDALAGMGFDIRTAAPEAEDSFMTTLDTLLGRAQRAGAVRSDVDVRDVKILLVGCQAMQRYNPDLAVTRRVLDIIGKGLATDGPPAKRCLFGF
jgi:AcrR family transcriptional regulator